MHNVAKHTSALVKKQEQLGVTMFNFGVAFTMLAKVRYAALLLTQTGVHPPPITIRQTCF